MSAIAGNFGNGPAFYRLISKVFRFRDELSRWFDDTGDIKNVALEP